MVRTIAFCGSSSSAPLPTANSLVRRSFSFATDILPELVGRTAPPRSGLTFVARKYAPSPRRSARRDSAVA
jgi:hypothetical protein